MKAEVKKIVLDLGGKEIELSVEQAKKLESILHEMFGVKSVSYPIYIRENRWWWENPKPYWTCETGARFEYTANNSTAKLSI